MARPHYVTLATGQMQVWRSGQGRPLVALPSLVAHAADTADALAAHAPGCCVTAIEWPGIGGSATLPAETLQGLAAIVREALDVIGLGSAPIVAFDIASGLGAVLDRPLHVIAGSRADAWASRQLCPPDLTIRDDGTHLTALWAFMRSAALLLPTDGRRGDCDGDPLPTSEQLDRAVVASSVDPPAYARLWDCLLDGMRSHARNRDCTALDGTEALVSLLQPGAATPPILPTAPIGHLWCDYIDTPFARVHLRRAGSATKSVMVLQSAPGSTEPLTNVIRGLSKVRSVIAPDFPGNGDSGKPSGPVDIARIAGMMLSIADALGLTEFDLWGTHTGALVALEMALQRPNCIGRVILEAPPILPADFSLDILAHYLPPLRPDRWGLHLQQAWNMRRDMFLFWPWYRDQRESIRPLGLPDKAMLHQWTIGLLKSGSTYDLSYRAAFEYPTRVRLPLIGRPTLLTAGPADMLVESLNRVSELNNPHISARSTPATVWYPNQATDRCEATLEIYRAFLDASG